MRTQTRWRIARLIVLVALLVAVAVLLKARLP